MGISATISLIYSLYEMIVALYIKCYIVDDILNGGQQQEYKRSGGQEQVNREINGHFERFLVDDVIDALLELRFEHILWIFDVEVEEVV